MDRRKLWLTLPGEEGDERAELFARPRATIRRLASGGRKPPDAVTSSGGLRPRSPDSAPRPERQLFRPRQAIFRSAGSDGLLLIEAPGMLGEVRLVAREVKSLLLQGTRADDIPGWPSATCSLTPTWCVRSSRGFGILLDVEGDRGRWP